MAILPCDFCSKEIVRPAFCSDGCRSRHFRGLAPIKNMPENRANKCEVCFSEKRIAADHNHQTGNFRGWLCGACNLSIGLLKEKTETLQGLIEYLKRHKVGGEYITQAQEALQSRFAPRTKQNEQGEYINAPGFANPKYDYQKGYEEVAIEI